MNLHTVYTLPTQVFSRRKKKAYYYISQLLFNHTIPRCYQLRKKKEKEKKKKTISKYILTTSNSPNLPCTRRKPKKLWLRNRIRRIHTTHDFVSRLHSNSSLIPYCGSSTDAVYITFDERIFQIACRTE
jgi:hypothetical protein